MKIGERFFTNESVLWGVDPCGNAVELVWMPNLSFLADEGIAAVP